MSPGAGDFPPGVDPRSGPGEDPPAQSSTDLRPTVAGAGAASTPWLAGGGAVLLGLLVFLWLSAHRPHAAQDLPSPSQAADVAAVAAPPPPPEIDAAETAARNAPATPAPAVALVTPPPPAPVIAQPPPTPAPAPAPPSARAPVLVVDLAEPADAAGAAPAQRPKARRRAAVRGLAA